MTGSPRGSPHTNTLLQPGVAHQFVANMVPGSHRLWPKSNFYSTCVRPSRAGGCTGLKGEADGPCTCAAELNFSCQVLWRGGQRTLALDCCLQTLEWNVNLQAFCFLLLPRWAFRVLYLYHIGLVFQAVEHHIIRLEQENDLLALLRVPTFAELTISYILDNLRDLRPYRGTLR